MRIAGLAVMVAVVSGMVVPAGAASAVGSAPTASLTPSTIRAGQSITATVTDCDPPEGGGARIESELLTSGRGDLDSVEGEPGTWRRSFPTNLDAIPRQYKFFFYCGESQLSTTLAVTVVGPAPKFTADFTPDTFLPGDRLTLTTSGCHTLPRVSDMNRMFTTHLDLHPIGVTRHRGSAVTKRSISPNLVYIVTVNCQTLAVLTFTLTPGQKIVEHPSRRTGGQTGVVPVGGVETGDGSSLDSGGVPVVPVAVIVVGGSALALTAGLWPAYQRRRVQEDS